MNANAIKELRSVLENHNPLASFRNAPDWVILNLYERHSGLPQSRTGMPATRSLAEINRKYEKRVINAPVITDEAERMKMRLKAIS